MEPLNLDKVTKYVEENIGAFHEARLNKISSLKLKDILKRKNPYLFKAKNIIIAQDLIKTILDAHVSSQEETMFGAFLEKLAVFICGEVFDGKKSSTEGIDMEFTKEGIFYLVSIKSGPNWGNSSQINKMVDYFRKAERTLKTQNSGIHVESVNGCCYGKDNKPVKAKGYSKFCGQRFWHFISDKENLYLDIIKPLEFSAKQKNDEFFGKYSIISQQLTTELLVQFCDDGIINWEKLVKFNSGK